MNRDAYNMDVLYCDCYKRNQTMKIILMVLIVMIAIPLFVILITIIGGAIQGLYQGVRNCFKKKVLIELKKVEIPDKFVVLLPFANKIGMGDDLERSKIENQLSYQEKKEIRNLLADKVDELESWIDTVSIKGDIPENVIPLSRLLEAASEMGLFEGKNRDAEGT